MLTNVVQILKPFLIFSILVFILLSLSRTGLALWQIDRFEDLYSLITLAISGFRIDLSSIGYLLIIPALIHPWIVVTKFQKNWLTTLKLYFFFDFYFDFLFLN